MKQFEIITEIKNGSFSRNINRIREAITSFNGKTVTLTIKVNSKERSVKQNRYYFGVIVVIWQKLLEQEWGEYLTAQEVHEFLKFNCNYEEKHTDTGEYVRMSKSTKENSTTDQEEFHEKCRRLAMEIFTCEIPLPEEQIKIKL
jgi:hypothetical protein